jgi:hypothetical protein
VSKVEIRGFKCIEFCFGTPAARPLAKARSYISRREVKVFGVEIFLYEWSLTAKPLPDHEISNVKIIYFSKRPRFSVC